ncbi:hypothetical protein G7075_08795 [Phycicoccus sp. HDW14]|uniref:hypothetical protein n=1 Tax=Phycicoccus sp. HDW14 TaxID=2714941 RepID=UPI00140C4CFD|nr:hypothetical protein [Phycicoccus sp. HDW14]QIM21204.1 hypothetical protein G7075_08795 [Phycicoccus sp. HDW14]
MRRLAVILPAAVVLGAGLVAAPAEAATNLPSAPTTAYGVFTGPVPGAGWGTRAVATGSLSGSSDGSGGLTVSGTTATSATISTAVQPRTGNPFTPGTYPIGDTASPTAVGVQVTGGVPSACSSVSGNITVHAVTLSGGQVTSFAASVKGNCGTGQPVFAQEVRWQSTVPMIALVTPVSTPKAEVVTVAVGPNDTTFGTPTDTGTDAKVAVTGNTCTGTRPANTTCTVTVTATPDFFGPAQDVITLPDGGAGRVIPVTSVGYDTATGAYTPLAPARLLDTRRKVGVSTTTPIGANKYIDLQVAARGGVPSSGVASVVLNTTVVSPTTEGYVTMYPTGSSKPVASSVNFNKGWTGANLLTVKVGTGGKVRLYNYSGNTHVVVDVMGYYHSNSSTATTKYGGYAGLEPTRILDTRDTNDPLPRDFYLTTGADLGPEANSHVKAFAVNITVTKPTGIGYLTAWNGDENAIPNTSTLNFTKNRTVPNMAVVPTLACGSFCTDPDTPTIGILNTSSGSAHVVVDLVGVYDDNTLDGSWRYRSLNSPTRIVNTKTKQGIPAAIGANKTVTVSTPSAVTTFNTMSLVTNTTANKPTITSVLTLWNADIARPGVSNLNPYAGQLVSNMTFTDLGAAYDFKVHNLAGSTNLVIDVAGTMEAYPAVADPGTGLALREDGLAAVRSSAVQRATGDRGAKASVLTADPVSTAARHR